MFGDSCICLGLVCSFDVCCGFALVLFGLLLCGLLQCLFGCWVFCQGLCWLFRVCVRFGVVGLSLVCGLVYCCCDLPCSLGCVLLVSWGLGCSDSGYGCLSVVLCLGLVVEFGFLILH